MSEKVKMKSQKKYEKTGAKSANFVAAKKTRSPLEKNWGGRRQNPSFFGTPKRKKRVHECSYGKVPKTITKQAKS